MKPKIVIVSKKYCMYRYLKMLASLQEFCLNSLFQRQVDLGKPEDIAFDFSLVTVRPFVRKQFYCLQYKRRCLTMLTLGATFKYINEATQEPYSSDKNCSPVLRLCSCAATIDLCKLSIASWILPICTFKGIFGPAILGAPIVFFTSFK